MTPERRTQSAARTSGFFLDYLRKTRQYPRHMSTPAHANSPIGANIRAAREASQMTQLALAHAIGWVGADAGAQISRFESGVKEPRISTLVKIARALRVPLDTLIAQGK